MKTEPQTKKTVFLLKENRVLSLLLCESRFPGFFWMQFKSSYHRLAKRKNKKYFKSS